MEELVVTTTDLARRTRELLDRVRKHNVQVLVTRHGQPEVAILDIDEFRSLMAARERLCRLEQEETLTERVMTYCDVDRDEARLRIADARQNVYTLVGQAHKRNPDVPPDVIDALVEEARETAQGQQ